MSDIPDYVENIKNMKHYQLILLFKVNRIDNKLVVKILKNGYKLKLETLESVKFVGIAKKINRQNKKCRKCTKHESS